MRISNKTKTETTPPFYFNNAISELSSGLFYTTILKDKGITEDEFIELQTRIQEEERARFGLELHDDISSLLAIAKLYIENIHSAKGKEKFAKEQAYLILALAIENIRNLSSGLIVSNKIDSPLLSLVSDLIARIKKLKLFKISFKHSGECTFAIICPQQKLMIFRILQEQMNNIIKHSKAKCVNIQLSCGKGNVTLAISDDGVGFDTSNTRLGTGIYNIYSRVNQFHGVMEIKSSIGKGCILKADFPIS